MTTGYHSARQNRQFHPRYVLGMTFGVAAILYGVALTSIVPAEVQHPDRHPAMPATDSRAPDRVQPVTSLGYVVFDWADPDAAIPGFGPLTADGQ